MHATKTNVTIYLASKQLNQAFYPHRPSGGSSRLSRWSCRSITLSLVSRRETLVKFMRHPTSNTESRIMRFVCCTVRRTSKQNRGDLLRILCRTRCYIVRIDDPTQTAANLQLPVVSVSCLLVTLVTRLHAESISYA